MSKTKNKTVKIAVILIINSFIITNLLSCTKETEIGALVGATEPRFTLLKPEEIPHVSSLISRMIELDIALETETRKRAELQAAFGEEMRKRDQLHNTILQQMALMARKDREEFNKLQTRMRDLERK